MFSHTIVSNLKSVALTLLFPRLVRNACASLGDHATGATPRMRTTSDTCSSPAQASGPASTHPGMSSSWTPLGRMPFRSEGKMLVTASRAQAPADYLEVTQ